MSFSANEKFNGLFERFPRSPFGVLKQITHHFYWESKPRPQVSASVLMFLFFFWGWGMSQLPSIEIVSLLSEEMRKTMAGLCWHCLKMVWLNSYSMHTPQITPHWGKQSSHLANGWACGGGVFFVWGQTLPFCFEKWTHRDHIWIQPMSVTESPVPFLLFWFCGCSI